MHDLLVTWPGGTARFSPGDSPIALGRSADAAVVLTDPAISRRHLEIVWLGSSWIANDSSTHGSFDPIGIRLAPTWTVGKLVTVRLGGVGGTEVRLEVVEHRPDLAGVVFDAEPTPAEVKGAPEVPSTPEVASAAAAAPPDPTPPTPASTAKADPPPPSPPGSDPGGDPVEAGPSEFAGAPTSVGGPPNTPVPPPPTAAPTLSGPSGPVLDPAPSSLPPAPRPPAAPPKAPPSLAPSGAIESVAVADHEVLVDDVDPNEVSDHLTEQVATVGENGLPLDAPRAALPAAESPSEVSPAPADASPVAFGFEAVEPPDESTAEGAVEDTPPPPPPPSAASPSILGSGPLDAPAESNDDHAATNGSAPRPSILGLSDPGDDHTDSDDGAAAADVAIGGIEAPAPPPAAVNGAAPPSILNGPGSRSADQPDAEAPAWDLPGADGPSAAPPDPFNHGLSLLGGEPPSPSAPAEAPPSLFAADPTPNGDRSAPPMPDEAARGAAPPSILDRELDTPALPPLPGGSGPAPAAMPPMPPGSPSIEPDPSPGPDTDTDTDTDESLPSDHDGHDGHDGDAFSEPAPEAPSFRGLDDEVSTTELSSAANNAAPTPGANAPGSWDDFMASHEGSEEFFVDDGPGFASEAPSAPGAPLGVAAFDNGGAGATEPQRPPAADTIITNDTIQVAVDGDSYVFLPEIDVTVGRDPSCVVNLDERHSLVSRHHLKISHRDGNWWIEDHSSKGTFIDGRKISKPYKAEGAFLAHLGDDDAGTSMRIITAGEHRTPRSFNTLLFGLFTVMVLAAVGFLAYLLFGAQGTTTAETTDAGTGASQATTLPGADLALAKQATVLLLSETGFGSGFFVTDTLIVTNQHVAVLDDTLAVAVSRTADEPAQVEFAAQTVALHPYLDIAVMEITSDLDGDPVSSSGLRPVPIGDSRALTLGDEVFNTGFPADLSPAGFDDMGDLLLPAVSTTSGEAANFSIWPGCSNPARDDFIPVDSPPTVGCSPAGDVTRAVVITTFSSGEGASGSPVFANNSVVAVVFSGPEGNENAGRNITTAAFSDWLDEVIADNG